MSKTVKVFPASNAAKASIAGATGKTLAVFDGSRLLNQDLLAEIRAHADETGERECCGLIIAAKRHKSYVRVRNIAENSEHFVMHHEDQAAAEDAGTILAVVHSHPKINARPSQADLVGIEKSQLPWVIMNWPTGAYTVTAPSDYVAPLEGREFSHGVLDCYTIVRDYYQRTLDITLKDYDRPDNWWLKGMDLYRDHFADTDFVEIKDGSLKPHDFLLIQVASPVANHGAIYLGENMILHHVMHRISCKDRYDGYWRTHTRATLRYKELL
jgi:proteasome lid subunit RPN8/RPN11